MVNENIFQIRRVIFLSMSLPVDNNFGKCWKIGEGIKGSWLKELEKDLRVRLFRGDALKFLHGP